MQITINISDKWVEEAQLDVALVEAIKDEVLRVYKAQMHEHINITVAAMVRETANDLITKAINKVVWDAYNGGNLVKLGEANIEQYVLTALTNTRAWQTPVEALTRIAKIQAEELRARYDLVFATQIVKGLQTQGLLKDDVANALFAPPPLS